MKSDDQIIERIKSDRDLAKIWNGDLVEEDKEPWDVALKLISRVYHYSNTDYNRSLEILAQSNLQKALNESHVHSLEGGLKYVAKSQKSFSRAKLEAPAAKDLTELHTILPKYLNKYQIAWILNIYVSLNNLDPDKTLDEYCELTKNKNPMEFKTIYYEAAEIYDHDKMSEFDKCYYKAKKHPLPPRPQKEYTIFISMCYHFSLSNIKREFHLCTIHMANLFDTDTKTISRLKDRMLRDGLAICISEEYSFTGKDKKGKMYKWIGDNK